jgi:hypothetical protein
MTSNQKTKEKEMKISQAYRTALIAIHTIDSAAQKPKSALRGLMQRLGLALLACTLVSRVYARYQCDRYCERQRGARRRSRSRARRCLC